MSKFNSDKVMPRYFAIAVAFTLIGVAIIGKAGYIMTAEKQYWSDVAARLVRDSLSVKPTRGNILSCDGQLMASSIPEFRIFMDFMPGGQRIDTMWTDSVDLICEGLNRIFPAKSAKEFKRDLTKGFEKGARHWPVWKQRIDYGTYTEVKKLPVFRLDKNKGGFHTEEFNSRRRPFGSLASRTVGDMFGAKDTARCGLELSYDSILRGTDGITHRRKVLKNYMSVPVTPPVNGADIITTIDVTMQDIAERSLIDELRKVNGDMGVAILMEVQTGDVKAMVNMTRCADGEYREIMNNAISYRCEPGSVFKPASIMVALDDGVVDTSYVIHTGSGVMDMHGRFMKDHNWRRGGYQDINVARALEVSSNIGVSYVIDRFYYDHPEKYVEGLYRTGIADDLHIPLVGYAKPIIRMPKKNKRGQWLNWSKTALPWMSIGYETQVAPINTVAFYNAIANDGKMMRPRFVKKVVKNGETIMEFPPVVQKLIYSFSDVYKQRSILQHELGELGETNSDEVLAARKVKVDKIKDLSVVITQLDALYDNFKKNGVVPTDKDVVGAMHVNSGQAVVKAPSENKEDDVLDLASMSVDELKKLLKNEQTKLTRARNQLLYGQDTVPDGKVENPMPDSPKKVKYTRKVEKLTATVERIKYRLAELA